MDGLSGLFGNVIYSYTREQALDDGELVEVSNEAKKFGFKISVAVTSTVWSQYIEWTNGDSKRQIVQNQLGRLKDILWMAYLACRSARDESSVHYKLRVVPRDGKTKKARLIELKVVVGAGDNSEPVITIMLPSED